METFSALLAICAGNSPVTGEFPSQRPVKQSFDAFFDLRLNKRLSKHREVGDLRRHHPHHDVIVMYDSSGQHFQTIFGINFACYFTMCFPDTEMSTNLYNMFIQSPHWNIIALSFNMRKEDSWKHSKYTHTN